MSRTKKSEIEFSPECDEAWGRLVKLTHQLSAMLTGDTLSPDTGQPTTSRSMALAMGMVYFLIRADPEDFRAAFFSEKSLAQLPFKPFPAGYTKLAPLAPFLGGRRQPMQS